MNPVAPVTKQITEDLGKMFSESVPGKLGAGALGPLFARHVVMAENLGFRDVVFCLKLADEPDKRLHLGRRYLFVCEITHQANADSDFIHLTGIAMRPVHLVNPAMTGFNLARARSGGSVIDDEMITQSVPEAAFAVASVK